MGDVAKLFGELAAGQENIPSIVEAIEKLLEKAKLGEVRSLALVYIDGGDCTNSVIRRGDKLYASLVGAVVSLQTDVVKQWHDS